MPVDVEWSPWRGSQQVRFARDLCVRGRESAVSKQPGKSCQIKTESLPRVRERGLPIAVHEKGEGELVVTEDLNRATDEIG